MISTALIKRGCGHWKGGYFSAYDQFLSYGGAGAVIKNPPHTTKHRDEGSRKLCAVKALSEMGEGPPESAGRSRLQTTPSCEGKEPWW